jgi:hypothetical protein
MNLGDIFYWITDRAIGHDARAKYHVYVCPPDWVDEHTFLFINRGPYGDDYRITKADYPFLDFPDSYISCGSIVSYSDAELASFDMNPIGQISKDHLRQICLAVADSKTMERQQIKRICEALNKAI